jgi:hypothetical protein
MTRIDIDVSYERDNQSMWLYFGPWAARIIWGSGYGFGYRDTDGPITRFVRRWWSGWHRWENEA